MWTQAPPEDVAAFLNSKIAGARTLALGTNLFASEPIVGDVGDPSMPLEAVFVWSTAGFPPIPYMGVSRSVFYPRVQVRVRTKNKAAGARQEGRVAARGIIGLLHRASISGYASILANESEPIHLGQGTHGGFEYGLNFDLIFGASP